MHSYEILNESDNIPMLPEELEHAKNIFERIMRLFPRWSVHREIIDSTQTLVKMSRDLIIENKSSIQSNAINDYLHVLLSIEKIYENTVAPQPSSEEARQELQTGLEELKEATKKLKNTIKRKSWGHEIKKKFVAIFLKSNVNNDVKPESEKLIVNVEAIGELVKRANGTITKKWYPKEKTFVAERKIGFFQKCTAKESKLKEEIEWLKELSRECDYILPCYGYVHRTDYYSIFKWTEYNLRDYLAGKPNLAWQERIYIARSIAKALDYIHKKELVHHEITSANVLLTENLVPMLYNFATTNRYSVISKHIGNIPTSQWTAPEVFKGEHTNKSDVYSFSIILWELASEKVPFENASFENIWLDIHSTMKRPQPQKIIGAPVNYQKIMEQGWDHNPKNRPTMEEMLGCLDKLSHAFIDQAKIETVKGMTNDLGETNNRSAENNYFVSSIESIVTEIVIPVYQSDLNDESREISSNNNSFLKAVPYPPEEDDEFFKAESESNQDIQDLSENEDFLKATCFIKQETKGSHEDSDSFKMVNTNTQYSSNNESEWSVRSEGKDKQGSHDNQRILSMDIPIIQYSYDNESELPISSEDTQDLPGSHDKARNLNFEYSSDNEGEWFVDSDDYSLKAGNLNTQYLTDNEEEWSADSDGNQDLQNPHYDNNHLEAYNGDIQYSSENESVWSTDFEGSHDAQKLQGNDLLKVGSFETQFSSDNEAEQNSCDNNIKSKDVKRTSISSLIPTSSHKPSRSARTKDKHLSINSDTSHESSSDELNPSDNSRKNSASKIPSLSSRKLLDEGKKHHEKGQYKEAFEKFVESLKKEDLAESNYWIGYYYFNGLHDGKREPQKSMKYLYKAAEKGHPKGQYLYALLILRYPIENSNGDFSTAIRFLKEAAKQNHVKAMKELISMYMNNHYVERDTEKARKLKRKVEALMLERNAKNTSDKCLSQKNLVKRKSDECLSKSSEKNSAEGKTKVVENKRLLENPKKNPKVKEARIVPNVYGTDVTNKRKTLIPTRKI
ncbi:17221_t:CDS:2 [Acaulospora morrowiae]|uniref:17221_t:CDS:1 n=1 Tax=Acaulospora morrowiae TaxID=94023 RepID=A0A9N8W323_9GLOM|nr:17221_t:CDS:2 [Acaulospora morrowiae]